MVKERGRAQFPHLKEKIKTQFAEGKYMLIAPKSGPLLLALSILLSGITAFRQASGAAGQSSSPAAQAVPA